MWDETMAPEGYYTATFFSQYFPISAPRDQHGRLKNEMAEKVINKMAEYAPDSKRAIMDKVVFAPYLTRQCSALLRGITLLA
jgi:phytoene dehydrogenase-like protein